MSNSFEIFEMSNFYEIFQMSNFGYKQFHDFTDIFDEGFLIKIYSKALTYLLTIIGNYKIYPKNHIQHSLRFKLSGNRESLCKPKDVYIF